MTAAAPIPVEIEPVDEAGPREAAATTEAAEGLDLQRIWLAAQRQKWSSLALVPVGRVPTPRLAEALAGIGRQHLGHGVVARDATRVTLRTLEAELAAISGRDRCAERAIVALPRLHGSPAGLALAQAADLTIVCIALGETAIAEAEQVLDDVGRDRVLGSVIFKERNRKR